MRIITSTSLPALILLFYQLSLRAQVSETPVSATSKPANATAVTSTGVFDLLSSSGVTEITLKTNMDSLMIVRKKDEYIPGTMIYRKSKKEQMTIPVRIKCRGKFRRMTCDFPPIKLKFRKEDLAKEGLNDFNELKLVTHCLDEKIQSQDLIIREYLAYKLYRELTPHSFRVQLVRVNYDCTATKRKFKQWGILMEDSEEVAHRAGGVIVERMGIPPDSLITEQEHLSSLFEFMISNVDWSITLNRNIELVQMPDGMYLPIPYDFDFSGLVSAPYSRGNSDLGQTTVRDRVFIGNAMTYEELKPTIDYFLSKKSALLNIVRSFKELDLESKEFVMNYLGEFFKLMEKEETAKAALFSRKTKN